MTLETLLALSAMQDGSYFFNWNNIDPVPPKNTVPVSNPGYDEDDPEEALLREDPDNIKFYTELARRVGALTVSETALAVNVPDPYYFQCKEENK